MIKVAILDSDADLSGIASALRDMKRSAELVAERAALTAAERAAENHGDEAAVCAAMSATDEWMERTANERVRLFGRGGWPR